MNKKYCTSCGEPTQYSIDLPKFCANCSQPFSAMFANVPAKKKMVMPKAKIVETEDEEEEMEEEESEGLTFNIASSVEFTPEVYSKDSLVSLGDTIGTGKPVKRPPKAKNRSFNKKEALKSVLNKASAKREAIDID
jgi:hypothetical protein